LVVIHTAEGARTTASLGNYFAKTSVQASSHAGIDDNGIETYVPYSEAAWTLRSGNSISDNVELCGFAAWTRTQWLTEHRRMLDLTAQWVRERCLARGIPIRRLTPQQVAAGQAGVCGHYDWTIGMRDGSHTDPGPGFPWDYVIDQAARSASALASPPPPPQLEDDLMASVHINLDAARTFTEAIGAEVGGGSMVASRGWVTFGSTYGGTTWKRVTALSNTGSVLASWSDVRTTNNTNVAQELPPGTRCVTVEGQSDNAGTRPWASVWCVR
jgi:hypothetical protein